MRASQPRILKSITRTRLSNASLRHFSVLPRPRNTYQRNSSLLNSQSFSALQSFVSRRSLHTIALTEQNIQSELLDSARPVVLKFEAAWCGPCQQLTPILTKSLETYANDKVVLATLDVDTPMGQELAGRFQVRTIPVVFVLYQGQVISHFGGVLPQPDMDKWTQELVAMIDGAENGDQDAQVKETEGDEQEKPWLPADAIKDGQIKLKQGKYEEAMKSFGKVVSDPTADGYHPIALAGMARASLKLGKVQDAKTCIDSIPTAAYETSEEVRAVAALVKLVEDATNITESKQDLLQRVENDKNDLQAYYDLAQLYAAEEDYDEAVSKALHVVRRNKTWEQGKAKDFVLAIIKALGEDSPVSKKARTKLANAMF